MAIYTRFKKNPDGLRMLVALLESTAPYRREKMIDLGMLEDPEYTERALSYVITFRDILALSDPELTELLSHVPAQVAGTAAHHTDPDIKAKFERCAPGVMRAELHDIFTLEQCTDSHIGVCQLKMIAALRRLEQAGTIRIKKIPAN